MHIVFSTKFIYFPSISAKFINFLFLINLVFWLNLRFFVCPLFLLPWWIYWTPLLAEIRCLWNLKTSLLTSSLLSDNIARGIDATSHWHVQEESARTVWWITRGSGKTAFESYAHTHAPHIARPEITILYVIFFSTCASPMGLCVAESAISHWLCWIAIISFASDSSI